PGPPAAGSPGESGSSPGSSGREEGAPEDRVAEYQSRFREIALRLADSAEDVARTFEQSASFHDLIAATDGHPLQAEPVARAQHEREVVASERAEAVRLRALAEARSPSE